MAASPSEPSWRSFGKNSVIDLRGKVALITGAASGIGLATARALAAQEVRLVLLDRDPKLPDLQKEFACMGSVADVDDLPSLEALVQRATQELGGLDLVFANAGTNGVWAPLAQLDPTEWEQTLRVNLTGTFLTIRAALPALRARGGGSIIVTASVNGTRMFSNTGCTAYACSKAGQVALVKMLALELAPENIRVNVICPGYIESNIHAQTIRRQLDTVGVRAEYPDGTVPLSQKGVGKPEQVASVVLFLASELSSHVTGTEIFVDGAQSLLQG